MLGKRTVKNPPQTRPDHWLFSIGTVTESPTASFRIVAIDAEREALLDRHAGGVWRDTARQLQERNHLALRAGGRVVSAQRWRTASEDIVFVIETDLAKQETTIWLPGEWEQRERDERPERTDPGIQDLMARERRLVEESEQLGAAISRSQLEGAHRAEQAATAALDALVVREATGTVAVGDVEAAQRTLATARERTALLERRVQALTTRLTACQRELEETSGTRKAAEQEVRAARQRDEQRLSTLINQHEQDAEQARGLHRQLTEILARMGQRQGHLRALGGRPNAAFFAGYGLQLDALVSGTAGDHPCDNALWEQF